MTGSPGGCTSSAAPVWRSRTPQCGWAAGWRCSTTGYSVRLARAAAYADDNGIDRLVAGVAAVARSLGRLARRPETGQVYAYYAQAAVALAVLALIFALVR